MYYLLLLPLICLSIILCVVGNFTGYKLLEKIAKIVTVVLVIVFAILYFKFK